VNISDLTAFYKSAKVRTKRIILFNKLFLV
jgi:hypothetical protein